MLTEDEQYQMFDCSLADLDALIAEQQERKRALPEVVMSMLSDLQEMVAIGLDKETIRRSLNRAKYLLDRSLR